MANNTCFMERRASYASIAQGIDVRGNQVRFYDASTIAEWLKAEAHGDTKLAALFERRLMPEMRAAFEVWKRTDPLHNPSAPPSPMLMPEYHNVAAEQSAKLNQQAAEIFEQGTDARQRAYQYVRQCCYWLRLSQRFKDCRDP